MSRFRAIVKGDESLKYLAFLVVNFFTSKLLYTATSHAVSRASLYFLSGLGFLLFGFGTQLFVYYINRPTTSLKWRVPYLVILNLFESVGMAGCFVLAAYISEEVKYKKIDTVLFLSLVSIFFMSFYATFIKDFGLLDICVSVLMGHMWKIQKDSHFMERVDFIHLGAHGRNGVMIGFLATVIGLRIILLKLCKMLNKWAYHSNLNFWAYVGQVCSSPSAESNIRPTFGCVSVKNFYIELVREFNGEYDEERATRAEEERALEEAKRQQEETRRTRIRAVENELLEMAVIPKKRFDLFNELENLRNPIRRPASKDYTSIPVESPKSTSIPDESPKSSKSDALIFESPKSIVEPPKSSDVLTESPKSPKSLPQCLLSESPKSLPQCFKEFTRAISSNDSTGILRFVPDFSGKSPAPPAFIVGVVFCGKKTPGDQHVIWGIFDALKKHKSESRLIGLFGDSEGLLTRNFIAITDTSKIQGGDDLLEHTKVQIRTAEQVDAARNVCITLEIDALVVLGGVTSNTDAAHLAVYFAEKQCPTKVIGIPVTSNGDLENLYVEANVGFDTICKVNSRLICNICSDAPSADKYHFIRLIGGKTSHVALECALMSQPNMVILAEEVAASNLTLSDIIEQLCDAVQERGRNGKNHGVILFPEGLIESIPEIFSLAQEIHALIRQGGAAYSIYSISTKLSPSAAAIFEVMPPFIREQFFLPPESDDFPELAQVETEKLLAHLVEAEIDKRLEKRTYVGKKFNAICHVFGYQSHGFVPSKFDCDYAYVLGHIGYHIIASGLNGYMATITNLKNPVNEWCCAAVPITAMMTVQYYGRIHNPTTANNPAIHPALIDLRGNPYLWMKRNSTRFLMIDEYVRPGPLQIDGAYADALPLTLYIGKDDNTKKLLEILDEESLRAQPGCSHS